jgi:transcriptional regulator with XRE-family HTH domain
MGRTNRNAYANIIVMAANNSGNPATHFGRQMKKERIAHGWTLREFAERTGISFTHVSRIENGFRPPTENIALACDAAFPERHGWFMEYYEESKSWTPHGFRDWPEHENKTATIREWSPMVVTGMLQTEDYARALLAVHPGVTDQIIATRLANRMERQQRVLFRDDPPTASYVIDHSALYRSVGSPEIMAEQMRHLAEVAAMQNVLIQVLPAVACPAIQGGFLLADDAAFAETVVGGYVYVAEETVTSLAQMFAKLRAECYRASESAAIIRKAGALWTGESQRSVAATAVTA